MEEKYWKLELTNAEISIVKIAVEKYVEQYTNYEWGAFTHLCAVFKLSHRAA